MIKSDFYPTSNTYATLEVTSSITNLNLTTKDVDPCRAYYMGQLKSDDIRMFTPKKFEIEKNELEPGKSIIKLTETDTPVWWGYSYVGTDSNIQHYSRWDPTNLKYNSSMRMINSAYSYYINNSGDIKLRFRYLVFEQETVSLTGLVRMAAITNITNKNDPTFTMKQFIDIMENDTEITVTFTIDNVDTDFTVKMSDFQGDGILHVESDTYIALTGLYTNAYSYYYGDSTRRNIMPFISMSLGDKYFATNSLYFSGGQFDTRIYFDYRGSEMDVDNTEIVASYCGYPDTAQYRAVPNDILSIFSKPFSITWDDLRSVIDGSTTKWVLLGDTNSHVIFYSTSTTGNFRQVGLIHTFDPYNYYTILCLINKYRSSGFDSSSSANNAIYYDYTSGGVEYYSTVALFNTDNSPKSERASYDGDYPEFQKQLRDWQKYGYNITDDEFNPDQPIPPGGDDDPGSDDPVDTPLMTGDDQDLQTDRTMTAANDFITLYNITPPMLSIFGRTLWKSIADYNPQDPTSADIFKNFFAILNEEVTGTLDIGAILQFVVSVRQYPFNVAGMGITTSAGDSIKIGTGVYPISLGSGANVQKLTSTIGLIDCGAVTIADYKDFKLYNDFRDYLNATVTAFLPYCGSVELNPIEVIHNTVHCYYAIDFYTGECTAYITTTDGNHTVLSAIKNGSIGVLVPITATNSGQISARHMSDNAKDAGLIVSNLGNLFGAVANAAQGNIAGFGSSILGMAQNSLTQKQMQAERQGRSAVLAPSLSGGSGAAAFYQPSCPSIVVRRGTYARQKINNYPQTCAYPSTTSGTLKSFHGYTECYNVNVSGLNCTEEERAAVKSILESGCYLP